MDFLQEVITVLTEFVKTGGPFFGVFIILLESVIPALPLGVFITLNMQAFGILFGFFLSWLATCLGC